MWNLYFGKSPTQNDFNLKRKTTFPFYFCFVHFDNKNFIWKPFSFSPVQSLSFTLHSSLNNLVNIIKSIINLISNNQHYSFEFAVACSKIKIRSLNELKCMDPSDPIRKRSVLRWIGKKMERKEEEKERKLYRTK